MFAHNRNISTFCVSPGTIRDVTFRSSVPALDGVFAVPEGGKSNQSWKIAGARKHNDTQRRARVHSVAHRYAHVHTHVQTQRTHVHVYIDTHSHAPFFVFQRTHARAHLHSCSGFSVHVIAGSLPHEVYERTHFSTSRHSVRHFSKIHAHKRAGV